jgi:hypothetical protein
MNVSVGSTVLSIAGGAHHEHGVGHGRVDAPAVHRRGLVDGGADRGRDLERVHALRDVGLERREALARRAAIEPAHEAIRVAGRVERDRDVGLARERRRDLVERGVGWHPLAAIVTAADHRNTEENHQPREGTPHRGG